MILPRQVIATVHNYRILTVGLGQYKSMRRWECVGADDRPVPWYTYPAIEYLRQLDFSGKTVFEYGSGNSTRFWADRCKKIVSVEDNPEWYEKIAGQLPANAEYHLLSEQQSFVGAINNYPEKFDIVIIDGSHRYECAVAAVSRLKDDGFIVLDNSDWYGKTSGFLRDADLIEVDMSGFGPINGYTWTTSIYFRRNVALVPQHERQPAYGIGSAHRVDD